MRGTLVGLALLALVGCDNSSSSSVTNPSIDNMAGNGHTVVHTDHGRSCIPAGQPIPPGAKPVKPPTGPHGPQDDEDDGEHEGGKPPKECNGHHQGGGNDHHDCGKDGKK